MKIGKLKKIIAAIICGGMLLAGRCNIDVRAEEMDVSEGDELTMYEEASEDNSLFIMDESEFLIGEKELSNSSQRLKKEIHYNSDGTIIYGYNTYEYNSNGYITKCTTYSNPQFSNSDGKEYVTYTQEYDSNGNRIKYTSYNEDGSIFYYSTFEYDGNGNLTKSTTYKSDGSIAYYFTYEQDSNGNLIKETDGDTDYYYTYEYDSNGIITKKEVYRVYDSDKIIVGYCKYDSNGNITEDISYDIFSGNINWQGSYTYEYDNNGNMIKYIRYYEDGSMSDYNVYEYDSSGNKTKEIYYKNDESIGYYYTYDYDSNGNMIKMTAYNSEESISDYYIYEYYTQETSEPGYSITTSGIYCSSTYPSIVAGMVTNKGDFSSDVEYRWIACEDSNPNVWFEVSPWTKNNEWLNWTPDKSGNYVIVCQARIAGDEASEVSANFGTPYNKYIKGKCQMPYTGEGGGYLIGFESGSNPNQSYQYEMLILDCTLLAEGKDAWIYTTGKCGVAEGNALWTVWQPQYGYYWTLFRLFDADGNMIDEACYGFANVY